MLLTFLSGLHNGKPGPIALNYIRKQYLACVKASIFSEMLLMSGRASQKCWFQTT